MPTVNQVLVHPVLTNVSIGFAPTGFIAEQVFPVVPVEKSQGLFWVFGKESFARVNARRAPGTQAAEVDFGTSQDTYDCIQYALQAKVTDEERSNNSTPLSLETRKTQNVTELLLLDQEFRMAALLADTAVWADSSPGTKWDAAASSTPIEDVGDARETVRLATGGREANTMVLPQSVLRALQSNSEILARMPAERGIVTLEILRQFFEIERILVPKATYNQEAEGQTPSLVDVWGDMVWLGFVASSPALDTPSAGYIMRESINGAGRAVESWYNRDIKATIARVIMAQDEKVACADAGCLLTNLLT